MNEAIWFEAIVILSRGVYNRTAPQLERLAAAVRQQRPDCFVTGAVVDQSEPSLPAALTACRTAGARRILVVPIFIPGDPNLLQWLTKVIRRWQEAAPDVAVTMAEPLSEATALSEAVCHLIANSDPTPDVRQSSPPNWENDPDGWSKIPDHRYHLLFCRGPRCTALGADELWPYLQEQLAAHGLRREPERVLCANTGCLYPCNLGPVMIIYPDGVWYGRLTKTAIDQIVQSHFLNKEASPQVTPILQAK